MRKIIELSDPVEGATHCLLLNKKELELLATLLAHTASDEPHIQTLIMQLWRTENAGLEKVYNYDKPKYSFKGRPALRLYTVTHG